MTVFWSLRDDKRLEWVPRKESATSCVTVSLAAQCTSLFGLCLQQTVKVERLSWLMVCGEATGSQGLAFCIHFVGFPLTTFYHFGSKHCSSVFTFQGVLEAAELQPSGAALPACVSATATVSCLWKDGTVVCTEV